MPYPKTNKERGPWWLRRMDFSQTCMDPWYKASRRIQFLYENRATNLREQLLDDVALDASERSKPNICFGWIDQTVSNSNAKDPRFRAKLIKGGSGRQDLDITQESPQNIENLASDKLNDMWRDSEQRAQDRRVQRDAYFLFGVKKLGVVPDPLDDDGLTRVEPEIEGIEDPEEESLLLSGGTFIGATDDQDHEKYIEVHEETLASLLDEDEDNEDGITALEQNISDRKVLMGVTTRTDHVRGKAFGTRWFIEDFRMDWNSQDGLKDAEWIAFRVTRPLDAVKDDTSFNSNRHKVTATHVPEGAPNLDIGEPDDFGMVTYWEIYARNFKVSANRRINLMVVVAEQDSGGMVLRHTRWPFGLKEYPCELLTYNEGIERSWFGNPYLLNAGVDNTQEIVNEFMDSVLSTVRKQKNVVFYDPDVLDEVKALEMVEGAGDQAIPAKGLSQSGAPPAVTISFLNALGDGLAVGDRLLTFFDRAAGTPQPALGDEETATEAAINNRKTTAREDFRDELFEEYQIKSARKMWMLQAEFDPELEGLGNLLRFEIDVSGSAVTVAVERKQWSDLLSIFAGLVEPSLALGIPPPDLPAIAEQLLVRGFDIDNPEDLWPAIAMDDRAQLLAQSALAQGGPTGQVAQPTGIPEQNGTPQSVTPGGEIDILRREASVQ